MKIESEKSNEKLRINITENKETQPLLGLNRLVKLEIGLQGIKNNIFIRNVINDGKREKIIGESDDLFKNNHTVKDLTIDIQLKKDVNPIQQK